MVFVYIHTLGTYIHTYMGNVVLSKDRQLALSSGREPSIPPDAA